MTSLISIYRAKPRYFQLLILLAIVYGATVAGLLSGDWGNPDSGHGPIVLVLSLWLLYRKWDERSVPDHLAGGRVAVAVSVYIFAASLFVIGTVGQISQLAYGSLVPFVAASLLLFQNRGRRLDLLFPVFFLLFSIPLPGFIVDPITLPMKQLVASATDTILSGCGYPVARSGVMLFVGPYELQVADACAGLRTLFTLEALGLLYLNLFESASALRNVSLAILVVPISFVSNIIRVISLCLITFYWGDAAGQGYLHEFAGIVLFLCALMLLIAADAGLRFLARRQSPRIAV